MHERKGNRRWVDCPRLRTISLQIASCAMFLTATVRAQPDLTPTTLPSIFPGVAGAAAPTTVPSAPPRVIRIAAVPTTMPLTPTPISRSPVAPATSPMPPQTAVPAKPGVTTSVAPRPVAKPGRSLPYVIVPEPPAFGAVPQPSAEVRDKFSQWIRQVVDPENTLDLIVGKPRILILKQAPQKVQIPDERVAAYDVLSEKELSVTGVALGTTVLNIWFEDKTVPSGHTLLSYFVRVMPDPEAKIRIERVYQALEMQINKAFSDSRVTLTMVGSNLLVGGEAKDAADADKIIEIVEANFVSGGLNGPTQRPADAGNAPGAASGATPPTAAEVAPPTPGDILALARNGVTNQNTRVQRSNPGRRGNVNVINMLRVPGENQVMLRVTVAEVNRSAARSIGLNFSLLNSKGVQIVSNLTGGLGTFSGSTVTGAGAGAANLPMLLDHGQLGVALEALRTLNLAKSLAEPNLVTINGQTATFQAGGKFPVPVVTGATSTGLQGVQFIPFGVQLNFTPFITEKDIIRLVLDAEVSTRDASSGSNINGASVSGLDTRNVQTTVDLKPGQTLAVAGLIQQNYGATGNRIPFFGDMPLLSSLLGVNQTSTAEQELIILINAEIVRPMDAKDVPPLPGHDLLEPSDAEFFLGGRLESRNGPDFRSPTRTDFERLTRYQRLQRAYLFGPLGHSDGRTGEEAPTDPPPNEKALTPTTHSN
jgi:pilus assembly protein CpaC